MPPLSTLATVNRDHSISNEDYRLALSENYWSQTILTKAFVCLKQYAKVKKSKREEQKINEEKQKKAMMLKAERKQYHTMLKGKFGNDF